MTLPVVDTAQFAQLLSQNKKLVVKFSAKWCQPCKAYAPTVQAVAEQNPTIAFVEVDLDASPELAAQWRVRSIPATIGFKDGSLAFQASGALTRGALEQHLKTLT